MTDLIQQITGDLQKQIESFEPQVGVSDIGTVLEAGDGIARVQGLANVRAQGTGAVFKRGNGYSFQP